MNKPLLAASFFLAALLVALLSLPRLARADISQTFGDITVHYNAISTLDLSPEVARSYRIERSKTRGLLTIAVIRQAKSGSSVPIPATISAYATNPVSQLENIDLRKVHEGNAIYYLGEFRFAPPTTLEFSASIRIGDEPPKKLTFSQEFY